MIEQTASLGSLEAVKEALCPRGHEVGLRRQERRHCTRRGKLIEGGRLHTQRHMHGLVPWRCLQACSRLLQYRPFPLLLYPSACHHYSPSSAISSISPLYVPRLSLGYSHRLSVACAKTSSKSIPPPLSSFSPIPPCLLPTPPFRVFVSLRSISPLIAQRIPQIHGLGALSPPSIASHFFHSIFVSCFEVSTLLSSLIYLYGR